MALQQEELVFFIGCYTEMLLPDFGGSGKGIYTVSINKHTGTISLLDAYAIKNPSYLKVHNNVLYAVTEVFQEDNPKVSAFRIKEGGSLEFINTQDVDGGLPCHVNAIDDKVLVSCYGSGNLLVFPINSDGSLCAEDCNFRHSGNSVNKDRQEAPHAHQVMIHPDQKNIFVPDLGIDIVKVYSLEEDVLNANPDLDITIPEGNGPRHIVFNTTGNIGYVMNELTSKIVVLTKEGKTFKCNALYDSLPNTYKDVPSGSAIRIHPNGQFLYVANRTIDAITIFKIEDEGLELLDYQYTNGKTLREFNVTPDGNWLLACMQDSNEVISYKIQPNGLLEEKARTRKIISPVCVCFN